MSDVTDTFFARWRSGRHIGPYTPQAKVYVRKGEFKRAYRAWNGPTVNADIYGESRAKPWYPLWTPSTAWVEVPGAFSINMDQDFQQDGTTVATLQIENTLLVPTAGTMGYMYSLIQRGALSPMRGYKAPGMPFSVPAKNAWYDLLVEDAQIKVLQGYGTELARTFIGFIDKVSPKTTPDTITLTARCTAGKVLPDEHIFGWNKSKQLPEPVVFEMSKRRGTRVALDPTASSSRDGHPARFAADSSSSSTWISSNHSTDGNTEWVQIRLKRGTYRRFVIQAGYPDMEVYVGIFAKASLGSNTTGGSSMEPPTLDGVEIDEGWVDVGNPVVPGGHGGWEYVRKYNSMSDKLNSHNLPGTFELGDDSILRIGFRRLHKIQDGIFRASVARLHAIKEPAPLVNKQGKPSKVVIIQDPSDMVRCALRWAGFTDWKVDDTGVALEGRWVFTRADTYMDLIKKVQDATGFIFYMETETADDDSLGVPTFRQGSALAENVASNRVIRDTDLLTELEVNLTDDPKSYIIRVRGRDDKSGLQLGAQTNRALMAVYRPPWSAGRRMAKIIRRHYTHTDPHLKKQVECEYLARLIAFQMALEGATATAIVPGTPEFDLDDHVGLVDTGTGTATRLYVVRRSSEWTRSKEETRWMSTIGGSLLDNRDVYETKRDILTLFRKYGLPGKLTMDA